METTKRDVAQEVTQQIIALFEKVNNGDIEYWLPLSGLAYNPVSKRYYKGVNQLLLSFTLQTNLYSHNNWLTFQQINEAGGSVVKGEQANLVTFTETLYTKDGQKMSFEEAKQAFIGAKDKDPTISTYKEAGISKRQFLKYYLVFNVAQTKGLPEKLIAPELMNLPEHERLSMAEAFVKDTKIKVTHVSGNSAHYNPHKDIIQMPQLKQFKTKERYYATLFHEMIHATGHETRLNRVFGESESPEYAFEELIAELGSTFLYAHFQIPAPLTSSSAYIKSWLAVLENNKDYIFKAMRYAERAMDYLLIKEKK